MPRKSPYKIVLSGDERSALENRARKYTLAYYLVQRAKIVLLAHEGLGNNEIAERLDTRREVVCFWRKRFFEQRLAGLDDRDRPGRPRVFPPRSGHGSESSRV
ncbi:MAG: helix-turn-helix domain-containing protein [bacterium]